MKKTKVLVASLLTVGTIFNGVAGNVASAAGKPKYIEKKSIPICVSSRECAPGIPRSEAYQYRHVEYAYYNEKGVIIDSGSYDEQDGCCHVG